MDRSRDRYIPGSVIRKKRWLQPLSRRQYIRPPERCQPDAGPSRTGATAPAFGGSSPPPSGPCHGPQERSGGEPRQPDRDPQGEEGPGQVARGGRASGSGRGQEVFVERAERDPRLQGRGDASGCGCAERSGAVEEEEGRDRGEEGSLGHGTCQPEGLHALVRGVGRNEDRS